MGGNLSVLIVDTPVDAETDPSADHTRRIAELEAELKHERDDKARLIRDHEGELKRLRDDKARLIHDHEEELQRLRDVITADHANLRDARAKLLTHQRLGSVPTIEPGSFTSLGKAGEWLHPFAELTPGRLQNGTLVLRIQLKPAFQNDEKVVLRFKQTMAIMQALQGGDGSLLRIVGASQRSTNDPIAYVEHVTGMTLKHYLTTKRDASWPEKLHIAVQIATAIAHMHNLAVMHRDLSWLCVYVEATGRVKVFPGLKMRDTEPNGKLTNGVTEARWSAPETLATTKSNEQAPETLATTKGNEQAPETLATTKGNEQGASYDDKIDIFGLGLLLIAFVTHDGPFMHILRPNNNQPIDDGLLCTRLQDPTQAQTLLTSDFGPCPSNEYQALAFACIQLDPDRRPTAPEVVRRLEALLQTYGGPMTMPTCGATVNLTVAVHKTLGMTFEPTFGSSYALECLVSVDDASRKPVKLVSHAEDATSHAFGQETTIANIDPVDWTLQLVFKTPGFEPFASLGGRRVGKATMPLVDFLVTEKGRLSLSAPRSTVCDIYGYGNDGGTIGKVLRERLEDYEARIVKARDVPAEKHRKRNLVAQALLRDGP
ncbi:TKL/LISK protein kinase [Saprolegnia parasitica CBS 223.65]|uniref:TKL/LISK protein kinase n=1 Tax=Saprolegnia parasitica (strain CBS 223.65) TaxID=695850 RepID=A0A067CFZ4_SAPPC|nr:TKL/LISK protein kinase [Saprolegnia parasitica CBS 223.65]KDO25697.1 TKL/LISK protein kinase [Saprolegnia parasitica CBS 223.65]|eukprot:XP_012203507.1 TKL/LISK protein kinase [Saprolegnia parasitica CBS 223.65]